MKFLLILQGKSADLCRDEFEHAAREAGELVGGEMLADPQLAITVPDRAGATPIDAYYLIDVETPARALELAYLLPDTRASGRSVEIRAVMHSTAVDF
ncbi:YciI family protein [Kribbella swartbergensis]